MRVDERPEAPRSEPAPRRPLSSRVSWRLIATDAAAISLAVLIGLRLDDTLTSAESLLAAVTSMTSWMSALVACRSRAPHLLGAGVREFLRVLSAGVASLGAAVLTLTVFGAPLPAGLIAQWVATGLFVLVGRLAWRVWLARRRDRGDHLVNVLIAGRDAEAVAQRLAAAPSAGLNVTDVRDRAEPDELSDCAVASGVGGVVLTAHSGLTADQIHDLRWRLEGHGIGLMVDIALLGTDPRRLELWTVDDYSLVRVSPRGAGRLSRWTKWVLDRGCALIGLMVLSPFLAVVAAMIRAEDGGSVFFRQTRVGENGTEFQIVKFRTMSADAEARVAELQASNEVDGPLFKMKDDPRVTRIGRVLRRYSIDELPQLWNVLVGEMSLVGPRPALPSEVAEYGESSRRRLLARPGITGLWQVSGRSDLTWERGIRLDVAYIDNWSLLHDGLILARTVGAVVRPRGAY